MMSDLPTIPDKRYFTIGEVSQLCHVKPHVLRYWEQEFTELRPCKRRGNRRYYQHDDVLMVRRIRRLLYEQGFTIGGARQQLSSEHRGNELTAPVATQNLVASVPMSTATVAAPTAAPLAYDELIQSLKDVLATL